MISRPKPAAVRRFCPLAGVALLLFCTRAVAQERYALSMFHFNIQYVAGGIVSFPGWSGEDLRPKDVEDRIVTESLSPVIELLARHPTWGADLEMQAYLLDVLAERHPAVLQALRELATSGQVDVLSFHYSDQLFIAYPAEDWEHSQALAADTFAKHGVPLGTSVFCQEGQSGMGMAARMKERGYETMIWPKNLRIDQHGDFQAQPLYRFGDTLLVFGAQDVAYAAGGVDLTVTWTFFDDGELLATGGNNPYFPDLFVRSEQSIAEYEARLADLEAGGTEIVTVRQYVDAIRDRVPLTEPPPLLDGTWQPQSTSAVGKWMGVRSIWNLGQEPADRDNHVRTLGALAHRELMAAETAATAGGLEARAQLDSAWRLLALGQVTDASGINPYRGEVEYGIAHLTEALRIARDVVTTAVGDGGVSLIDPETGAVDEGSEPFAGDPSNARVEVTTTADDPARAVDVVWERIEDDHHRVTTAFGPGDPDSRSWPVAVKFAGTLDDALITTLALADDAPYEFSRADFSFGRGSFHMALPLGMVSLGGGLFVIKDMAQVHVAAEVHLDSGDVKFRDETVRLDEGATWVFHVFEGSARDAAALARRVNGTRAVVR